LRPPLARASLERAAENGITTVSVEMVDEIAALYGSPAEAPHARTKHPTARAFALGAVAALVVLALVVAAAEVKLLGTGGRRIRANVESLSSLAGFGPAMTQRSRSTRPPPRRCPMRRRASLAHQGRAHRR
jgi:hypothetical protein